MLLKMNVPSCSAVSRRAAKAHGPACPCCRPSRAAVRVSAAAPSPAAKSASVGKDGLVRIVDEAQVRAAPPPDWPGAAPRRGPRAPREITWA